MRVLTVIRSVMLENSGIRVGEYCIFSNKNVHFNATEGRCGFKARFLSLHTKILKKYIYILSVPLESLTVCNRSLEERFIVICSNLVAMYINDTSQRIAGGSLVHILMYSRNIFVNVFFGNLDGSRNLDDHS